MGLDMNIYELREVLWWRKKYWLKEWFDLRIGEHQMEDYTIHDSDLVGLEGWLCSLLDAPQRMEAIAEKWSMSPDEFEDEVRGVLDDVRGLRERAECGERFIYSWIS